MTSSPTSAVSPNTTPMPWSMKNLRPITAPGWISTPVIDRTTVMCTRTTGLAAPPRSHRRCASRYAQMACSPGEFSATSIRDAAAGSRVIAASRSSMMRRRARWVYKARVTGYAPPSVEEVGEEDRRQVPLAERRDDDHDRLAGVLGAPGDLVGGREGGTRGQPDEQALLLGGAPRPLDGGLGVDVDDLVVDVAVEDLGDEVGADALDLVGAGLATVEDRRL